MTKNWGTCRYQGCQKQEGKFFCAKHERELFDSFEKVVRQIHKISSGLYFGRTHFPERRLLQHAQKERDRLTVLHWASCYAEVKYIEEEMIKINGKYYKGQNKDVLSSGKLTSPWNCIYVAWKKKEKESEEAFKLTRVRLVETDDGWKIDPGHRLWPRKPGGEFTPIHLANIGLNKCEIDQAVADSYLDWRVSAT